MAHRKPTSTSGSPCMFAWVCAHVCMCMCLCVYMCVYVFVCVFVCIAYVCMHVYVGIGVGTHGRHAHVELGIFLDTLSAEAGSLMETRAY